MSVAVAGRISISGISSPVTDTCGSRLSRVVHPHLDHAGRQGISNIISHDQSKQVISTGQGAGIPLAEFAIQDGLAASLGGQPDGFPRTCDLIFIKTKVLKIRSTI